MHVPSLIEKKREGQELSAEEIDYLIMGFTRGEIADYQMSAWAMAVFFRGMTPAETQHLTKSMMESGRTLDYAADSPPKVDKHSTGGIGDKISLVLAPLLACDEVWVPMISGRALGITGGTLDKLESIPGFNVHIDERRALAQLESIGLFIIGQTEDICPADKKLYALRDVTGTVPSQALIVASIMSKKLAENLDRLVLDVKFGSGAFMKTRKEAKQLAASMTKVGKLMGVRVSHLLSPMDEPLGRTVGNALEVAECVEVLQGGGPRDIIELTLDLAEQVSSAPRAKLAGWLSDGMAWRKFISLVYAQDGDASTLEKLAEVRRAVIDGANLSAALSAQNLFPDLFTDMMAVGEQTGHFAKTMQTIADVYERELDRTVKVISALIPPVIIVLIAIVVGFVVYSILSAVFEMTHSLQLRPH